MAEKQSKLDFKQLKKSVDIVAVAQNVGYQIDASRGNPGSAAWTELTLGNRDRIIVGFDNGRNEQFFFRKERGHGVMRGDVIDFIRENLGMFPDVTGSEWSKVAKIMRNYSENGPVTHGAVATMGKTEPDRSQRADFKKLKSEVNLINVAQHLGYKIDYSKGGERAAWTELTLGELDRIIVGFDKKENQQFFFRRHSGNGAMKGDVITLIRENLDKYPSVTGTEWHRVAKIMSDYANRPAPEYQESARAKVSMATQELDVNRYEIKSFNFDFLGRLFKERKISEDTAKAFSPYLCMIRDLEKENFKGYNLGFPYTLTGKDKHLGYEIRGINGFKSKAAGSDSSVAAWIADFSGDRPIRNVYFFESAFDAMAFYQLNQARIDVDSSVFISVGGQTGRVRLANLMQQYHGATIHDCFDNDASGRVYGLRMAEVKLGIDIRATKTENGVNVEINGVKKLLPIAEANASGLKKHFHLDSDIAVSTAPHGFKDWNDVVKGDRMEPKISETKYARDEHLAERRKSSRKL